MKKISCKCSFTKAVMLNSFQHLHLNQPLFKEEEILNQVQDDNRRRGFTLIELLVVVLIIGILAAVAVPQYQVAVAKSRYATLKNLVHNIHNARAVYYLTNNEWPTKFEELDIDLPGGAQSNEDGNTYTYPWGVCVLASTAITCTNTLSNLEYQVYPNKVNCVVSDNTDTIAQKVCKSETQRNTYTWTNGTVESYRY